MAAQKMEVTDPLSYVLNIYPYAPYTKNFTAPAIDTIFML
jgi:hypothetical protein